MAKTVVNLSDQMAVFVQKANLISTHVGDIVTLTTTNDSDLVGAVNELDSAQGNIASLDTTNKSNLVAAVNELHTEVDNFSAGFAGFLKSNANDVVTAGSIRFDDTVPLVIGTDSDFTLTHTGGTTTAAGDVTFANNVTVNGNVGIGTATPTVTLEVANASNPALSGVTNRNTILQLQNTDTGYVAGNATAIDFGTSLTSATASIIGRNDNAGSGFGGSLIFATSPTSGNSLTERMRISPAGNVGIGTASPSKPLHVSLPTGSGATPRATAVAVIDGNDNTQLDILGGSGSILGINFGDISDNDQARITCNTTPGSEDMAFTVNAAERMRIDDNGNVLVASSTNVGTGDHKVSIQKGTSGRCLGLGTTLTTASIKVSFVNGNGTVGTIQTDGVGTTYNTTSDVRLKQDIEPLQATDKLMAMNPVSYHWKADPQGPRSIGFIAQEMQDIMPEAVSGDDEGMMGMDYGRITPIIVAALQEANKKIEELQKRIEELEAK